jgi:hypothetical protein
MGKEYMCDILTSVFESSNEISHMKLTIKIFAFLLKCASSTIVCKGKAIPFQAWGGPLGSRRLRLSNFKKVWHMKMGGLSDLRTGRL